MTRQELISWFRLGLSTAISIVATVLPLTVRADDKVFASIGTGELSGIYYPVGDAICRIVDQDLRTYGVRCSPETTPGSVYNIDAFRSGELEFAIVQSDVQFAAYHGDGAWTGEAFADLRSVFSLYPEPITVIARADAHIKELAELAGRRVNVGSQGSGVRATWDTIEAALGWDKQRRVRSVELREDASVAALCSGAIDASLMIIGHPSSLVGSQPNAYAANFVAITGPAIDKLLYNCPYYQSEIVPAKDYGMTVNVPTFGGRASLVTSASVDTRIVAVIAKEVLTHLKEFQTLHPVLAGLNTGEMIKDGLTAPLHPGAAQVYKELELRD